MIYKIALGQGTAMKRADSSGVKGCVHVLLSCELCLRQKWFIYVSLAATIGMNHLFVLLI